MANACNIDDTYSFCCLCGKNSRHCTCLSEMLKAAPPLPAVGWICPKCGVACAPFVAQCPCGADERPEGLKSATALRKRVEGREIYICTLKDEQGKFGRYLAELWDEAGNVNDWLLAEGLAEPYGE